MGGCNAKCFTGCFVWKRCKLKGCVYLKDLKLGYTIVFFFVRQIGKMDGTEMTAIWGTDTKNAFLEPGMERPDRDYIFHAFSLRKKKKKN